MDPSLKPERGIRKPVWFAIRLIRSEKYAKLEKWHLCQCHTDELAVIFPKKLFKENFSLSHRLYPFDNLQVPVTVDFHFYLKALLSNKISTWTNTNSISSLSQETVTNQQVTKQMTEKIFFQKNIFINFCH